MIGNHIKVLRKHLGLTQVQFAATIGIRGPSLSAIEAGSNAVTNRLLTTICAVHNVNRTWLETGTGSMFSKPETPSRFVSALDERISKYNIDELPPVDLDDALNMVEALVEILTAKDEEDTKTSIRNNLRTFQEMVREKKELLEYRKQRKGPALAADRNGKPDRSGTEVDFKTQGRSGERRHLRDKQRVGGKYSK